MYVTLLCGQSNRRPAWGRDMGTKYTTCPSSTEDTFLIQRRKWTREGTPFGWGDERDSDGTSVVEVVGEIE